MITASNEQNLAGTGAHTPKSLAREQQERVKESQLRLGMCALILLLTTTSYLGYRKPLVIDQITGPTVKASKALQMIMNILRCVCLTTF